MGMAMLLSQRGCCSGLPIILGVERFMQVTGQTMLMSHAQMWARTREWSGRASTLCLLMPSTVNHC